MTNDHLRALVIEHPDTLDIFQRAGLYVAPCVCGGEAVAVTLIDDAIRDAVRIHQGQFEHRVWRKRMGLVAAPPRRLTPEELAELVPPGGPPLVRRTV